MSLLWIALLGCEGGTEVVPTETVVEAPESPAPVAGGPDGGPQDGLRAGEGVGRVRLSGELVMAAFETGVLQLDAVAIVDGQAKVVAVQRYARTGPFRIDVHGGYTSVLLVAYHDAAGDGPSADDERYEYAENPIDLVDLELIEGITFVLDEPVDPVRSGLAPADQGADLLDGSENPTPAEPENPTPVEPENPTPAEPGN